MPEHAGGVGYKNEEMVLYNSITAETCSTCNGYIVKVERICPRCITQGILQVMEKLDGNLVCPDPKCYFGCLPAAYEAYWTMALDNFICNCGKKTGVAKYGDK
jgi:hypothetical protein